MILINSKGFDGRLGTHETPLLKTREENRRLERNWPIDLI
jgi:hypothetical protein